VLAVPVPPEQEEEGGSPHQPRKLCTAHKSTGTDSGIGSGSSWTCSNWAGSIRWQPSALVVPESEEELAAYLAASAAAAAAPGVPPRRPLKVVGYAHSWASLYLPSSSSSDGAVGDTLALHRLAGITALHLSPDGASGTVQVFAGTSFAQLYAELHAQGLTLAWAPGGIQGLTVGGAVAVGFHGSQLSLGGVSSVVSAVRLYSTDGTAHDLSDETDPAAMRAARMGLGVCGIVTRVTLPVVRQHHLRRRRWRLDSSDQLFAQLPTLKAQYDYFHW
jgi:L-gulonolactone oxidase